MRPRSRQPHRANLGAAQTAEAAWPLPCQARPAAALALTLSPMPTEAVRVAARLPEALVARALVG
eukprot:9806792-Alexandrium_andersonii.AAC.1